jgi:hypothetical protein
LQTRDSLDTVPAIAVSIVDHWLTDQRRIHSYSRHRALQDRAIAIEHDPIDC